MQNWTFTTSGSLGNGYYYERIDDDANPNDGHSLTIGNGGGTYDERSIVDAGFLELVRQGDVPANRPLHHQLYRRRGRKHRTDHQRQSDTGIATTTMAMASMPTARTITGPAWVGSGRSSPASAASIPSRQAAAPMPS